MFCHTFVVLAYKQSEYIEACLQSLKDQSLPSKIVISTSTPSTWLDEIAHKYNVSIYVSPDKSGIANDWNFAFSNVNSKYVTLAHQDDVYHPDYVKYLWASVQKHPENSIIFTNNSELHNGKTVKCNLNLFMKKFLLLPMLIHPSLGHRWSKRSILLLGNPISCPSVTYHKAAFPQFQFSEKYPINLDWDAWLRIADMNGSFVYLKKSLFIHRVHDLSETSNGLKDNSRQNDDKKMFERLWPKSLARIISFIYAFGYISNNQ